MEPCAPRPLKTMSTESEADDKAPSLTITVPMGYTRNNTLPAGLSIFGRAFDEGRLIRIAYAYEQATKWRKEPALIGVGGFAEQFMILGASGVIAPLWSVKDSIAHQVAVQFYERVEREPDTPFAEILRDLRRKSYADEGGEDTWAAYTFYGDPLAVLAGAHAAAHDLHRPDAGSGQQSVNCVAETKEIVGVTAGFTARGGIECRDLVPGGNAHIGIAQ